MTRVRARSNFVFKIPQLTMGCPNAEFEPTSAFKTALRFMTLVFNQDTGGSPAVHALVIGVGSYDHLQGGGTPADPAITENMGQLDSPPISARRFCEWLLDQYQDEDARLSSVDLLISDAQDHSFAVPTAGGPAKIVDLEQADIAAISLAARAWKARGKPDDLMIFFFCGHGVVSGFKTALLASDFAKDDELPWDGAFSFSDFCENMRSCRAKRQVFFVDACRVSSDALLRNTTATLTTLVGTKLPLSPGVQQAVYFSTLAGAQAFGRVGEASLFTVALLRSLTGLGTSDHDDYWSVETIGVQRGLATALSDLYDWRLGSVQTPQTGAQSAFEIGRLSQVPSVPLYLAPSWHKGEEPPDAINSVLINREAEEVCAWAAPWEQSEHIEWKPNRFMSNLEAGSRYSCVVRYGDGSMFISPPRTLSPPYRKIEVPENGHA